MREHIVQGALPLGDVGGPAVEPRPGAGDEGPGALMTSYWDGYLVCGRRGHEADCPHPDGSPERGHWLLGFRAAAKTLGRGQGKE